MVVVVSPRLLGDTVRRVLSLAGFTCTGGTDGRRAVVAVVSAGRETEVDARHVITLAGEGVRQSADEGTVVHLADLRAALARVLLAEA